MTRARLDQIRAMDAAAHALRVAVVVTDPTRAMPVQPSTSTATGAR